MTVFALFHYEKLVMTAIVLPHSELDVIEFVCPGVNPKAIVFLCIMLLVLKPFSYG